MRQQQQPASAGECIGVAGAASLSMGVHNAAKAHVSAQGLQAAAAGAAASECKVILGLRHSLSECM